MKNMLIKDILPLTIVKIIISIVLQIFLIIESKTVRASVSEDFTIPSSGPEFIEPVKNQTAAIGREVTFSCSISNIGSYKVGWLRATDKTIISLHTKTVIQNDRIAVKYEPFNNINNNVESENYHTKGVQLSENIINGTWRLIIRHLKETDRGCYMCQINTKPMISQLGCLDILVSPDISNNETSTDISVLEGDNTTLVCKATGRPLPRISWKREDGKPITLKTFLQNGISIHSISIHNDSILNLYRIDRKQMGTYLCIASNDVPPAVSKRVTLSVNFLPNVQTKSQLLGAPLGTDVVLECKVEAYPNSVNYWYRNPDKMLLQGGKYSIEEIRDGYEVAMRLVIRQFKATDVGSYSCIASNSLGQVEGISRLYRIGDLDENDLRQESHHVSISAGLSESTNKSGSEATTKVLNIFRLFKIHASFVLLVSSFDLLIQR